MIKDNVLKDTPEENELIRKVYHTDARVTAMEGQLAGISSAMGRIEAKMMETPDTNYLGWAVLVAGVMFGVAQYVDLTMDPVRQQMEERASPISEFFEFKHATHYEFGKMHEWKANYDWERQKSEERTHQMQERMREVEKSLAGVDQRVRDNENTIDKVDAFGSRRWGSDSPPND